MERFYGEPRAWGEAAAKVTGEELNHLKNVLRLKPGDLAEVFDGLGRGFRGRISAIDKEEASIALEEEVKEARDSALRTCLVQGIPKGEKMEWIIQKAAELGVEAVLPLELSRCVVKLEGEKKRRDRQARWQKVAREAARQCGRLKVPEVMYPRGLEAFLKLLKPEDLLLIPWEEGGLPLKDFFRRKKEEAPHFAAGQGGVIYFMIGPEGGMTENEVESGRQAGGKVLTLGPRILRTETAGLMLLSVLQYEWGDAGRSFGGCGIG